jgi:hypothetical protein
MRPFTRFRAKLTYANVTATLALVLALGGGTAWAASKIRTRHLGFHAVTGPKIDTNAVTASKIRNGTIGTDDVKDGSLGAADVKDGSLGTADLAPGTLPVPDADTWGVVTSSGALARGVGVTGVAPGSEGEATVSFPEDVTGCGVVATVGGTTPADPEQETAGTVHAVPGPSTQQITFTTRALGAGFPPTDLPFHFALFCQPRGT